MEVILDDGVTIETDLQRVEPDLVPARSTGKPGAFFGMPGSYGYGYGYPGWIGGTGSTGAKWYAGLSANGQSPVIDHYLTRQNARSAFHDNSTARAVVERFADTVAHIGLRVESTPRSEILGISQDEAKNWARQAEQSFDIWARSKKSLICETMNFYQAQRLAAVFQQRDNDYFVRLHYSRGLSNPLQIQFIDPNQIKGSGYTSTHGYNAQDDGIERDENGREIAYKIWIEQKDFTYKDITVQAMSRSGRRFMLHCFQPEYAGQKRGYSRLHSALQEFENLTDFTSAEIKKAINQSAFAMYVKPSKDKPASNPLEGYSSGASGPIVTQNPGTNEVSAAATTEIPGSLYYQPTPEATFTRPGSAILFGLDSDEDLQAFPNTSPTAEFGKFVDAFTSYLCSSFGIPIEVMLMKFSENYSASRASLILFWQTAKIWQDELAADFLNPIYEEFLTGEIASGRLMAPGWSDPMLRQAWLANNWIGVPMPSIDPSKDAKATELHLKYGLTTIDRESKNLNGSDAESNARKLTQEYRNLPLSPYNVKKPGGFE